MDGGLEGPGIVPPQAGSLRATAACREALCIEVFLKFVNMEADKISSYIDSVAPDGDLVEISRIIRDTVRERIGQRGLEYPELGKVMYDSIVLP